MFERFDEAAKGRQREEKIRLPDTDFQIQIQAQIEMA